MYNKITLENGLRVVYEKIPYVRSVSLGVWVGTGSRNETKENNGISHFIEHMLFKGTVRRTAKDIAESIDNLGGQLNAFTGKECTCYYTKILDSHIDTAVDVLADMVFNSRFEQRDINVERKVILEEIGMYEDAPEELVHDILSEIVWAGDSLGYPILGTQECLVKVDKKSIQKYMDQNYRPEQSVISVAGNFDEDRMLELIRHYFSHWKAQPREEKKPVNGARFITGMEMKEKETEQAHLCIGFEGIEHGNDDLYTLLAVNNIFGGGMSSRLFQKIREERGLVYSIYSYPSSYKNAGLFTVYAGMNPEHMEKVIALMGQEIRYLLKNGINQDELQKSKEQLKGSYILGLESTSSRMNSIGKSELLLGRINKPDEVIQKIDAISMERVRDVIQRVFQLDRVSLSLVGNVKKGIDLRQLL